MQCGTHKCANNAIFEITNRKMTRHGVSRLWFCKKEGNASQRVDVCAKHFVRPFFGNLKSTFLTTNRLSNLHFAQLSLGIGLHRIQLQVFSSRVSSVPSNPYPGLRGGEVPAIAKLLIR